LRLPLLELAIPALKQLNQHQFVELKKNLVLLAQAYRVVSLMEWSLFRILERNVQGPRPLEGQYRLSTMSEECRVLLSALAHAGQDDPVLAARALANACGGPALRAIHLARPQPRTKEPRRRTETSKPTTTPAKATLAQSHGHLHRPQRPHQCRRG
jgi:hypothetical protein